MDPEPVIRVQDLTKEFGAKVAVNRLTLAVPKGAIFALLGENGAGKTTTIRILTGQLAADHGQALILGMDCWQCMAELRPRVGYVPERPRFYDWMTVSEIGWFTAGFHAKDYLPRYQDLARRFNLESGAKLRTLSKGQYAKVSLALALASNPEVLILDEPTSGLDLLVRREFLASMVELAGAGRTILISSHQIAEVERVASHVAFMHEGRLLLSSSLEELRQRIVRIRCRCEGPPPQADQLGTILQGNGSGKLWQAVLQDPKRDALDALRQSDRIFDFEESTLGLEEIYCALMLRKEATP